MPVSAPQRVRPVHNAWRLFRTGGPLPGLTHDGKACAVQNAWHLSGSASAKQLGGEALDFCQELAQEQQLVSIPGPIGVLFGLDNRFEIENTHTELLGAELRELLRLSRCRCSG